MLPPAVEDSVWQDKSPFKETLSEAEGYTAVDSDVGRSALLGFGPLGQAFLIDSNPHF